MYLWKQWRESRIVSAIGLLGLFLLCVLVIKSTILAGEHRIHNNDHAGLARLLNVLFYVQTFLIACWAWFLGSIGAGKNLGEDSGSFLFTRPRTRAWFLWHDWGFGMALLAIVTLLSSLLFWFLAWRLMAIAHSSAIVHFDGGASLPLPAVISLMGMAVLLCAGLVYSITYLSTIVLKRSSSVILGAGVLVGYLVLSALITHYYPSIVLPALVVALFHSDRTTVYGLAPHLGVWMAVRALVILLFPFAAQFILNRSEL